MRKGNQGVDVGRMLESGLENATKIGDMVADVILANGIRFRLSHEGSSAYALSYSGQKRINSLEGGTKPNIIMNGHLHKSMYMMYRNIHYFEAGSMQRQTPFMAMKGSPAMLGYWVLDLAVNNGQLKELTQKWRPFY
jgi:predicted phosphodiesterase